MSQNDMQEPILFGINKQGHVVDPEQETSARVFLGFLPESVDLFLNSHLSSNLSPDEWETSMGLMRNCFISMVQSEAGRATTTFISHIPVQIIFYKDFEDLGLDESGRLRNGCYIRIDPDKFHPPDAHLTLVRLGAQFAFDEAFIRDTKPGASPQTLALCEKARAVFGYATVLDHGEECLEAAKENPKRFVPPGLASSLAALRASKEFLALQIPEGQEARTHYQNELVEEVKAALKAPSFAPPSAAGLYENRRPPRSRASHRAGWI